MSDKHAYTLLVSSCERTDLLKRTVESYMALCDRPPAEIIVTEDGPGERPAWLDFPVPVTWINGKRRMGQLYSLDRAYTQVKTELVMHCEDDWEFYRSGFVAPSIAVLDAHAEIVQVWLRSQDDTEGHPVDRLATFPFDLLCLDYLRKYHGFSFGPGMRRMRDYRRIGSFGAHWPYRPEGALRGEEAINKVYRDLGYRAAILRQGYVRHIGQGRHVGKTMNEANRETARV